MLAGTRTHWRTTEYADLSALTQFTQRKLKGYYRNLRQLDAQSLEHFGPSWRCSLRANYWTFFRDYGISSLLIMKFYQFNLLLITLRSLSTSDRFPLYYSFDHFPFLLSITFHSLVSFNKVLFKKLILFLYWTLKTYFLLKKIMHFNIFGYEKRLHNHFLRDSVITLSPITFFTINFSSSADHFPFIFFKFEK